MNKSVRISRAWPASQRFLLVLLSFFAFGASAESVRWCLTEATFDDGTSLVGYFDYDSSEIPAYRVTAFEIQSEAAGDFPSTTYASPVGLTEVVASPNQALHGIRFYPDRDPSNNVGGTYVKLGSLTDDNRLLLDLLADGSVNDINLAAYNKSFECIDCYITRYLQAGSRLVRSASGSCGSGSAVPQSTPVTPVPALPLLGLLSLGGLLGFLGLRKLRQ